MQTLTLSSAALWQRFQLFFAQHPKREQLLALLRSRWFWAAIGALVAGSAFQWGLDTAGAQAKIALAVFACCVIAWSILRMEETPVAIFGSLALIAFGATTPEAFYSGMGDKLVWLLIATFVLAAVLKQSGVAQRWVMAALCAGKPEVQLSVRALFTRITWMIIATAFIIPSTSGRAALLLPVYVLIAQLLPHQSAKRGLALLFPTVILLSACASLLGAGAHLVAIEIISEMKLEAPGFAQWAWLGLPFAVASSFAAQQIILQLFVRSDAQQTTLQVAQGEQAPYSREQWVVTGIVVATMVLWTVGGIWGLEGAMVALVAALASTTKKFTGISLKDALKAVEWNLILFMAATLVMGEALLYSGAAQALAGQIQAFIPAAWRHQPVAIVLCVSLISLLAHAVITSRTARAMVLIPMVAIPFAVGGIHADALIFISVVASGFCQTFAVSAKPVALFSSSTEGAFTPDDLVRLSLWLLPVMTGLLLVFALIVWPLLGMPLTADAPTCVQ